MFITFEGIDGSGKSTVAESIYEKFEKEGYNVILTREPGGVRIAEDIRNILVNKNNTNLDERTEALLFAASRRQHLVEKVIPALKENKLVLCDRFIDSSLAYQGGARKIGVENILNINLFATENLLPDLTLLYDLTPELALERINKNKNREVNRLDLEKINFYRDCRTTYLELSKKYANRYRVIDASKPLEEVIEETYNIIEETLKTNEH